MALTNKQIQDSFTKVVLIAQNMYGNKVPNMKLEINAKFGYRTLGRCAHGKPTIIEINPKIPFENLNQTMVHEIAHAICGPGNGHNDKWYNVANTMGEMFGLDIKRTSKVAWEGRTDLCTIECERCKKQFKVSKRSGVVKNPQFYTCKCGGKLHTQGR